VNYIGGQPRLHVDACTHRTEEPNKFRHGIGTDRSDTRDEGTGGGRDLAAPHDLLGPASPYGRSYYGAAKR